MWRKIVMLIVLMIITTMMTGCLDVAWNSSGHVRTQMASLETKNVTLTQTPIPSTPEKVFNKPVQPVIVMAQPAIKTDATYENTSGTKFASFNGGF